VAGNSAYLYRAVDSVGDTIDFLLSPNRDLTAAKLFLRLALSGTGSIRPRVINVDGHPPYARAIAEPKKSGDLGQRCRCLPSPHLLLFRGFNSSTSVIHTKIEPEGSSITDFKGKFNRSLTIRGASAVIIKD
jgi:transposase-like protein